MTREYRPEGALGWVFPSDSRKAHYIDARGFALCRKYGFVTASVGDYRVEEEPGSDSCRACWRRAVAALEDDR